MQFASVLYRSPVFILGGNEDFSGGLYLRKVRAHCLNDRDDLVGVNAPHAQIAKFSSGATRVVANIFDIFQFSGDVM